MPRKRPYEHANGTESSPTMKRFNSDGTRLQPSIKTTEPKMRGSAVNLQNGGVSSGGRVGGGSRVRKHTSVNVDTLDDVCFKSNTAFRKRRKQQITTLAIRRGARKPWQLVVKASNDVDSSDSSVILLD